MSAPDFPHLPAEGWELYLRDELSGSSLRSVEEHLDACADCRGVLERRDPSRIFRRLRGLSVRETAVDGLWDAVRAEISAAPATEPAPAARRRERLGLLAGAATLLLSLVLFQSVEPAGTGESAGLFRADPCARLALSSEECRGLFVEARFDSEPPLRVQASADLAELL